MLRFLLSCIWAALLPGVVYAGAPNEKVIVFAAEQANSAAVSVIQKADFVSLTVTIKSDRKELTDKYQEILEGRNKILDESSKNSKIQIHSGPTYLTSHETSSFISKGYSRPSQSQLTILLPLAEKQDVFQGAIEIQKWLNQISPPGKASYELSSFRLAVDSPEKYRSILIKKIYEEAAQTEKSIGASGNITISGLESPVQVRQADDKNVELFINYKLSLAVKGKAPSN